MRVSRFNKYTQSLPQSLSLDDFIEVYAPYLNDPSLDEMVSYPMVIDSIHTNTITVFFDDAPQKLYTVPFKATAPVHGEIRGAVFSVGSLIDAKYRVDSDSPFGYWPGRIVKCVYKNNSTSPTHYLVAFPPLYDPEDTYEIPFYYIRRQTFIDPHEAN